MLRRAAHTVFENVIDPRALNELASNNLSALHSMARKENEVQSVKAMPVGSNNIRKLEE